MDQYDFRWAKSTYASPFLGPSDLDILTYSDSVTSQRETTILCSAISFRINQISNICSFLQSIPHQSAKVRKKDYVLWVHFKLYKILKWGNKSNKYVLTYVGNWSLNPIILKYGFCKKLLRYKWTSARDQLNTFVLTFFQISADQCWSGKKVWTKVFN